MERIRISWPSFLAVTVALAFLMAPAGLAEDDGSIQKIVFGVQGSGVEAEGEALVDADGDSDSDGDRDGRFRRYKDTPNGFVIDYLRIARTYRDGANYFDFIAVDPAQDDERYRLRWGSGDDWRLRYAFNSTPMVFGNGGRLVLGHDLRIADFIQQMMEDPDGNGVPFFSEPGGPGNGNPDNVLVQGMTRDLLTGASVFDLDQKRRTSDLDLGYAVNEAWTLGWNYQHHSSRGLQPLGSGTYQRVTDVDGDGATDYDYFFSVRGIELPAPVEYDTTNMSLWARFREDRWFGDFKYTFSEFDNDNSGLLYDNPFWFNGVEGTSGSRRGLHETARASLPPSNEAWNLSLTGGVDLADNTRLTASFTTGEHSQNDPFLPITTNPANIGTKDLNGDGVADALDDPTTTAILPQKSLDATSDITVFDLRLTTRPTDKMAFNVSWRTYEYDGGTSNVVIPARTEYIESRLKTDFKGTSLAFVPHSYEREKLKVEGVFDLSDDLRLAALFQRQAYDWKRYNSTSGNVSREEGNRAVDGTDDDTFGLKLLWDGPGWVDARVEFSSSERDFSGPYQIGFSGENTLVRQYDIAKRDRDAYKARFDFYPNDTVTIGVEARSWEDDYSESVYGFLAGESTGWTVDAGFELSENASLYLYVDEGEAETDMHLRTKCSNCAAPPGASWSAPWGVPNYDWFPSYEDEEMSFGGALSYRSDDGKNRFDLEFDVVDATIEQTNRNLAPPTDLGKPDTPPVTVSLAYDFPDQTNTFTTFELKYQRKLKDDVTVGFLYLYEDWDLDDFQLQQLEAYGADFLTVDDATRIFFLDAWYGTFDAQVAQFFLKMNF